MTTQTEALKLPQEQHFYYAADDTRPVRKPLPLYTAEQMREYAQAAIKEALARPEQEPVAWMLEGWGPDCGPYFEIYRNDEMGWRDKKEWTPLYTTPPQRTWVGLTPDDMPDGDNPMFDTDEFALGAAWAQAKLKEKNT